MIVAIAEDTPDNIVNEIEIPTTNPKDTMKSIIDWLKQFDFESIGVACFGPIGVDKSQENYGYILQTPKIAWRNFNFVGELKNAFPDIPIGFDTDVNAAVLAEQFKTSDIPTLAYITVGTGIGVGLVVEGKPVHGMLHPEMGHIFIKRLPHDDYEGGCPSHGDCIEGMVSAPNIGKRLGIDYHDLKTVDDNHDIWKTVSYYLSQLCLTLIYTVSVRRIVIGGGVLKRTILFDMIRKNIKELLNGYISTKELEDMNSFIVPSSYSGKTGVVGSLVLSCNAQKKQ